MEEQPNSECDVLIIGASLAGSCLARQLRLQQPELSIMVIDQKTHFDSWVGESTVEAFTDYAIRVLRLGPYLEKHHVQKQGLRFFFDSKDADLTIPEMSEFGRTSVHHLIAHNIDRAKFDRDMVDMNREMGISVRLGVRVMNRKGDDSIKLDGKDGHMVVTSEGTIKARWLIDAGGLNSPLGHKMGLSKKDETFKNSSYWTRYFGYTDIDELGDDAWRARTGLYSTIRMGAVNHFMYRGYWIWVIQLPDNSISVGLTFDSNANSDIRIRSREDLDTFLRTHKGIDEMLGKAEMVDFHGLKHLCRTSYPQFSEDRWALTGMATGFVDAIHSTSCWQIAMQNRFIGNAIAVEMAGERDKFESQVRHFNWVVKERFRHLRLAFGNFEPFGCFDYWTTFSGHRLASYFNTLVTGSMTDYQRVVDTANAHAGGCSCEVDIPNSFNRKVLLSTEKKGRELVSLLDEADEYYKNNVGQFQSMALWEDTPDIVDKFGLPQDTDVENEVTMRIYMDVCRIWAKRVAQLKKVEFNEEAFLAVVTEVDDNQTLVNIVDGMAAHRG